MIVYKEVEFKTPLYVARLDNGIDLYVYDGYAEDSNGKRYLPVIEETNDEEFEVIGWTET